MDEKFVAIILSLYDDFDKVYGPYNRKDGRQHIVLNKSSLPKGTKGKLKTISFPKAIMEVRLKRVLNSDETVDHIDKNTSNNSVENLQILSRKEHSALDAKRVKDIEVKCFMCGKVFIATKNQLRKRASGFFCSKQCSGLYGAKMQNKAISKAPEKDFKIEYYTNKDGE